MCLQFLPPSLPPLNLSYHNRLIQGIGLHMPFNIRKTIRPATGGTCVSETSKVLQIMDTKCDDLAVSSTISDQFKNQSQNVCRPRVSETLGKALHQPNEVCL